MFYGITLILLSIIAVPSLLLSRKPNAAELLEKVAPYQGWIGVVFCIGGLWGIISAFLSLGWLTSMPIWWVTLLAGSVVQAGLGFMLGFPLFSKWMAKDEAATAKADEIRQKLAPKQGTLGLVGIGIGIWMIVASFMFIAV